MRQLDAGRPFLVVLCASLVALGCSPPPVGPGGDDAGRDAGPDAADSGSGGLLGRWRGVGNPANQLEFLPDASFHDTTRDSFEAGGYACDGLYAVEGRFVRLNLFCNDADAGQCTHIVDLIPRASDGQLLSLTAFLSDDAPAAPIGVWHANSKRWRPVGPQLIDCREVSLISSYELTLTLSADAGFTFARHLEDLDPNSDDGGFRVADTSEGGAWRPLDGGVELINVPVLPLHSSPGPALLPGERLFERAP